MNHEEKPDGINKLLDRAMKLCNLRSDRALSQVLGVHPPMISRLRKGSLSLGPVLMIRLHEETGMSIREIKSYL